jgi:hypothetical protein
VIFEAVSDPVSDGKHIIYGMLLTALVVLAVVALGELTKWAGHRRRDRNRRLRSDY